MTNSSIEELYPDLGFPARTIVTYEMMQSGDDFHFPQNSPTSELHYSDVEPDGFHFPNGNVGLDKDGEIPTLGGSEFMKFERPALDKRN